MNDQDAFPDVGQVDVWKFKNDFDYSKFDKIQMHVTLCSVPWDVGLIHVGNTQIGGLGNVVAFESADDRDSYISSIDDRIEFDTEYRSFFAASTKVALDGKCRVPVPIEACTRFNYLRVEYSELPVNLEHLSTNVFLFFVREPRRIATNTTELDLMLDTWQTFMPGVNVKIPHMMLERGHAPIASLSAEDFLKNPLANTKYITGADVNFGDETGAKVSYENDIVFNQGDNVYACIVIDSDIVGTWGTKGGNTWQMPVTHGLYAQGVPDYMCLALPVSDYRQFMIDVDSNAPHFKQAVKAVFFATDKIVSLGSTHVFFGHTLHTVIANCENFGLLALTKDKFAYDSKYAGLAKLYTSPYAHIEIVKDTGETEIVKVEDTTGTIDIQASLSIAYPFITLTANATGIGGNPRNVTFKNLDSRSMRIGGRWQQVKLDWEVPTFAVLQDYGTYNDYDTHFDRIQEANDADTALANALASNATAQANALATNATAQTNALASNATAKTNADNDASTAKANSDRTIANTKSVNDDSAATARQNALNTAGTTRDNVKTLAAAAKANSDADADTITDNAALDVAQNDTVSANRRQFNTDTTQLQNAYNQRNTAIANTFIDSSTWVSVAAEKENATIGAIGATAGAALAASPSGIASAVVNYMQAGVSLNMQVDQAGVQKQQNNSGLASTQLNNSANMAFANTQLNIENTSENTKVTGQAANSSATVKANAARTKTANDTTADDSYTTDTANAGNTYNVSVANNANTANTDYANAADRKTTANTNAANSKTTADANANRTKATADANANRTKATADANADRVRDNATAAISNSIKQAALNPSMQFGEVSNAETATTRPIGVFAQVVTQSPGEIAAAGDEFLRFGYNCNMQWDFETWNLMDKFTYWKVSDLWIDSLSIPDKYADGIRFALMGGVCVWRRPEYIGKTSIYENGI